jgi:FtsP/CotA-like multicopper oxidase with cupredoxin domain
MPTETPPADGALARLARFCYRRRRLVPLTWILGVLAVSVLGFGFGAAADNAYSGGGSDSAKAQVLIEQHFPQQQGDTLTLGVKADRGIDAPATRQRIPDIATLVVDEGDAVRTTVVNRGTDSHPMHLHGHHVLVLSRNGRPVTGSPLRGVTSPFAVGRRTANHPE